MATEAQKRELTDKVTRLAQDRFGGDYLKAFAHYDANGDGRIDRAELGRAGLRRSGGGGKRLPSPSS